MNSSFEVPKANTIQNISQYARTNNTKMNRSTFEPGAVHPKIEQRNYEPYREIQTDRK